MKKYIYPQNLKAAANLWLWSVTRKNNPSELESILPKLFSDTPGQELDIEAGSIQI